MLQSFGGDWGMLLMSMCRLKLAWNFFLRCGNQLQIVNLREALCPGQQPPCCLSDNAGETLQHAGHQI